MENTQSTHQPHAASIRGDALDILGIAPAAARILRYFLLRPDAEPHARELQRLLHLGGSSLQRELERLVSLGALQRRKEGRHVRYRAVVDSPVWRAVGMLERASTDLSPLISDAMVGVPGLLAAFIFGSTARGTNRADSDVDLFVLEAPTLDRRSLFTHLAEVELLVGREVNAVRYTPRALEERLGDPAHPAWRFVRDALAGPKQWVAGDASALASLAAAADLPASALGGAAT